LETTDDRAWFALGFHSGQLTEDDDGSGPVIDLDEDVVEKYRVG